MRTEAGRHDGRRWRWFHGHSRGHRNEQRTSFRLDPSPPPISPWRAWGNALLITLVASLLFGLCCFVLLGSYLPRRMDVYHAAIWLQLSFSIAAAAIFAFVVVWQRSGSALAELGFGRPTTTLALVLSVILGAAYITGAYFGARRLVPDIDVTELTWVRLALVPLGLFMAIAEETLMRGLFMTELQRGRVPIWLQILASAHAPRFTTHSRIRRRSAISRRSSSSRCTLASTSSASGA